MVVFDKKNEVTYRKGGLFFKDGAGLTWGRSLAVSGEGATLVSTEAHESTHFWQQNKMGFADFYGRTVTEYAKAIFTGDWLSVYGKRELLSGRQPKPRITI